MTDWLDHLASDATDPQDGGEPFTYWWEDMRPAEVCELVKRAYERGRQSRTNALLDCYERAEDIDEKLQEHFDWMERGACEDVVNAQNDALRAAAFIQRIVVNALGGSDALVRVQHEREKKEKAGCAPSGCTACVTGPDSNG